MKMEQLVSLQPLMVLFADNLTINFGDAANNGTISLGGTIGTVPLASLNINASAGGGIMTIPAILNRK